MIKSYIIEVINTLQKEEIESFKLFLDSPYFNRGGNSENLKVLFSILADAKLQSTPEVLKKDFVYQKVFPESATVEGKLDKLSSALKKLLLTFLQTQRYLSHQHESIRDLDLLVELRLRGLEDRYFQALGKAKKRVNNLKEASLENYNVYLSLALEEHEWEQTFNKAKGDLNIPIAISSLDRYYLNKRLWLLNVLLLQQKIVILPSTRTKSLFEISENAAKYMDGNILFQVSWKIYNLLRVDVPTIEQFQELLQFLQSNEKKIDREYLAGFYTHLRNFCSFLIERGHYDLRAVQHQIHVDNLSQGYFYYDGKIPSNAFLNITQTALNVNDLAWANTFVEKHKDWIIGEDNNREFYRMNKALCLFAEKNFEASLEIIPFGSSYSFYHLIARRLELKIYYEIDSDLLPYKIDAFKMYISRAGNTVLSKRLHELHVNFVNFLRQLSLSPNARDKNRAEKMVVRINKKKMVADRTWLLEKARELDGRKK